MEPGWTEQNITLLFFFYWQICPQTFLSPLSLTLPHSVSLSRLTHTALLSLTHRLTLSQTPQCLSRWLCFSPSPTRLSLSLASSAACRRRARARCSLFHAVAVLAVRCFTPLRCLLFAAARFNACNFLLFSYHFMDSIFYFVNLWTMSLLVWMHNCYIWIFNIFSVNFNWEFHFLEKII